MNLADLMMLTGKSKEDVEAMLSSDEPISLCLTERKSSKRKTEEDEIKISAI